MLHCIGACSIVYKMTAVLESCFKDRQVVASCCHLIMLNNIKLDHMYYSQWNGYTTKQSKVNVDYEKYVHNSLLNFEQSKFKNKLVVFSFVYDRLANCLI